MGPALRDGVPGDAPALARIHHAARAAVLPGLRERHTEAEVAGWLAGRLMTRHRIRVAEDGGQPLGYIGLGRDAAQGPIVFHLYLDPARLRRGIGSRLMAEAIALYPARLSLFCLARNTGARAFYARHGFRAAAFSDGAATEEGEPDVLYVRDAAPMNQHRTGGSA